MVVRQNPGVPSRRRGLELDGPNDQEKPFLQWFSRRHGMAWTVALMRYESLAASNMTGLCLTPATRNGRCCLGGWRFLLVLGPPSAG